MKDGFFDHKPIAKVIDDPASSYWLQGVLQSASQRDPVDVMNDLETALGVMKSYVDHLLNGRQKRERGVKI